jgi:hypothetical protein
MRATRVVAIGDLHGDLTATRKALSLAGAIDDQDRWSGGDLVVVQTGDAIDRGDNDREILSLFERLRSEAARAGGAFLPLVGNHEALNVAGDMGYVAPAGFSAFAELQPPSAKADTPSSLPPEQMGRWLAFRPGGPIARQLARDDVVTVVQDTVFVHGGILQPHLDYGLDRMNGELGAWMSGDGPPPELVLGREGPLWTRFYAQANEATVCADLDDLLAQVPARRMVVGHTIQEGGIRSLCAEKLWRIDVGMSHAFGGPIEVLELTDRGAHVLRAKP